jgi:glycosyltransferase involved in cell wall biosynthesis
MTRHPLVSIVVPTKNSGKNLANFLKSLHLSTYKNFEVVVNEDNATSDSTPRVIKYYQDRGMRISYIHANTGMAKARKEGATRAKGEIILHLDSDMELSKLLLAECVEKLTSKQVDALVIPEVSFGTGFWAKCKALEKQCYQGVEQLESLRCLYRKVYLTLGGHDDRLLIYEDKDFDLRVRAHGYQVGRTCNYLRHNEGEVKFFAALQKRVYTGMLIMKTGEYGIGSLSALKAKMEAS